MMITTTWYICNCLSTINMLNCLLNDKNRPYNPLFVVGATDTAHMKVSLGLASAWAATNPP